MRVRGRGCKGVADNELFFCRMLLSPQFCVNVFGTFITLFTRWSHIITNSIMKKIILTILAGCLAGQMFAQNQNRLDSLMHRLNQEKTDTGKVMLRIRISHELQYLDIIEAEDIANNALSEADRLSFGKGIAGSWLQLANIAQVKGDFTISEINNRKALEVYESTGDQSGIAIVYNNLGILAHNQSRYEEAMGLYRKSLDINTRIGRQSGVATSLFCIGTVHENLSGNDSALYYYLEGQRISEAIRDTRLIAYAKTSIANIYYRMSDYTRSMEYNIEAVDLFRSAGNEYGVMKVYISLAQTAVLLDSLDKAVWFYIHAFRTGMKLESKTDLAIISHSLGHLYEQTGQTDSAAISYERARLLYDQTGNRENYAQVLISSARLTGGKMNYMAAVALLEEAVEIGLAINSPSVLMSAYDELAGTWAALNNFGNAYFYMNRYSTLKDSVLTVERQRQILELQTQFETEKKEKENELLKKDRKILQTTRNSLIIGALLLTTIVIIVLRNLSVKKKDNRLLRLQRDEITRQRDIVETQKTAIEDSIRYAKRIQSAMLPPVAQTDEILPESFILYLPRDIVSGDFYWIRQISQSRVLVCAADCTGHGVPGALMSMLGMSLLADIINTGIDRIRNNLYTPSGILSDLRDRIKVSLRQTGREGESRDGMDMTIAIVDTTNRSVICSGANNPVYLVTNGTLTELKSVRNPIGIHPNESRFTDHEATLERGSMIYLFSDGFYDQINQDGKKFLSRQFKGLLEELSALPPAETCTRLSDTFHKWKGSEDQVDDVLVIGIKV